MPSAKDRFLDYYLTSKSKGTYKSYRRSLDLFEEYYGKSLDSVLAERKTDVASEDFERTKRFDREVEKFYKRAEKQIKTNIEKSADKTKYRDIQFAK